MLNSTKIYNPKLEIRAVSPKKKSKRLFEVVNLSTGVKTAPLSLKEAESVFHHRLQLFGGEFPPRMIDCKHCGYTASKIVRAQELKNFKAKLICLSCHSVTGWLTRGQFDAVFKLHGDR